MGLVAWQATVQNENGNAVANPTVTVRNSAGVIATIYDMADAAKANPFVGSAAGFAQFQAYPGKYTIEGAQGGDIASTWTVVIEDGSDVANPINYGAKFDGVTNDGPSFQACMNANGRIKLPDNKTAKITTSLTIPSGLTEFSMIGGVGSKIIWDPVTAINMTNFTNYNAAAKLERIVYRDFSVSGNHATYLTWISSYPLRADDVKNVVIDKVNVSYSRVMGIIVRRAEFVSITNCEIHHCARDGINVGGAKESNISNNYIHHCDDDGIAVHSNTTDWQRGHIIANNKISFGQGIRALGVQSVSITGNSLQFMVHTGITVDASSYDGIVIEGVNATLAVTITGNTITDIFNRAFLDGVNSGASYISVRVDSAQPGSLAQIPGTKGTTPYGYYQNVKLAAENLATTPIPESGDINITGNTMRRTLPRSGMLSDQGLGVFWLRGGATDYSLTSDPVAAFIKLSGQIRNLTISDNIASGEAYFMQILADSGTVRQIKNAKVFNNTISDINQYVFLCAATTETLDIDWFGNTFDLDPYHVHPNRGLNGAWVTTGVPRVYAPQGALGLSFRENDFKNFADFGTNTVASFLATGAIAFEGNRFFADPTAIGFSTLNRGIGNIPGITGQKLVHIECDPISVDYGKIYRHGSARFAAMPTSGKYMTGEFAEKNTPTFTGSNAMRTIAVGWLRLSTGIGHVLDTDWAECRFASPENTTLSLNSFVISAGIGNGGAVTQLTDKTTSVTLNKVTGVINVAASALAAGASATFEVNNSTVTARTAVVCGLSSTSNQYSVDFLSASAGRFSIRVTNISAGSLSQSFGINFACIETSNT